MSDVLRFIDDLHGAFRAGDPSVDAKETEHANVRLLQEQYRAIARGDFDAAVALYADDVELEILGPPRNLFVGHWKGRQEVAAALRRNFALVSEQRPEIRALAAQGDTVVLLFRERGRYTGGLEYDVHCVQWITFRDGKVRKVCELIDSAAAFTAEPR